jgi:hypothetical protein
MVEENARVIALVGELGAVGAIIVVGVVCLAYIVHAILMLFRE